MDENAIVRLEQGGIVTATFRKLSPAKKEIIYKASLDAFAADVFDRVSLDIIADKAGVSKGSLIQYFNLKENLLLFVSEISFDNYQIFVEEYFASEDAVRIKERLEKFIISHFQYWVENQHEFRFLLKMVYENTNTLSKDFILGITEVQKERISTVLKRAIELGEIRRNLNIGVVSEIILAIFNDIIRQYSLAPQEIKPADISLKINLYLNPIFEGIKAGGNY